MFRITLVSTLVCYWTAIFVGTHLPGSIQGIGRVNDKVMHFGAYAGLAFLLAAVLTTMRVRFGSLLFPLAVAAAYGCFDELSQLAVPGRHADVADWAADVCGAGLGVCGFALCWLAAKRFANETRSTDAGPAGS